MMDLEETEDEDMDTIITSTSQQHWFEPNANSGDKVNCMLERGLNVGRKILVFGFVATSVPLVVPGFLVASAIGLVVSMPCCFFLVSHRCTQSLMSKLLPKPRLNSSQDVCFKQDIDVTYIDKDDEAKRDSEIVDVNEETVILDNDYEHGVVKEEFEPELTHHSGDADSVIHDDENMEGYLSGESSEERLMSRGTILKGFDETEELKAPFEFGDATVVLEECEDDVKEGDIDEEKMQEETKGLLEKIRDEGRNDMRGISSETSENDQVVENMEVGREEEQDMGTDGDMRNQEDSKVNNETIHDDNTSVCNEVESCEPTSGILELEDDGLNDQKKPVDETPELLDGRGFQEEPSGDLLIETQVLHILVAEDSFEVKELEHVISKKGELDENISNLVNQETDLCENNKRMNSSDADTDAREIPDEIEYHSCDEDRIDAGAHSYTIDLHEEPSNVTVDMHTDSLEVLVSSEEQESTSSKCASEKNFVCSSDEVLFNDENIWKQIHVVRKIIGYEGTIQASCADELKALYIFTGVEPPSFVKENLLDPAEINEKLHFLMSIVGVKMTDLP
ncbi:hypothetical protein KIW84_061411 [Lathyrus oleraceus]|uniref:Transmembrane protein n=1 Tax=Pisum sativum TaxID=3888 RepID=A0A9D4W2F1_PEA|nr:hypothetical protein KIW84_061411 [Pisum sativum]